MDFEKSKYAFSNDGTYNAFINTFKKKKRNVLHRENRKRTKMSGYHFKLKRQCRIKIYFQHKSICGRCEFVSAKFFASNAVQNKYRALVIHNSRSPYTRH